MKLHPLRNPRARGRRVLFCLAAVLGAAAAPAAAGEFGISADAGYLDLTSAKKSAQAVFDGSSGGFTFGGSLRYVFGRTFFVSTGARFFEKTGERVFVADASSPVFRLGHPLKLSITPLYFIGGYRFERDRGMPLVPYIGLGAGAYFTHEESEIGGITEDSLDQTKTAWYGVVGLEYGRSKLRFGVEFMYSVVPDSAGLGGVSEVYGEDDLGGFTIVGKLTFVP
jgi:hypothetical protein